MEREKEALRKALKEGRAVTWPRPRASSSNFFFFKSNVDKITLQCHIAGESFSVATVVVYFYLFILRIFFLLFIFLYSRFLLVIHFIHISVHMSIPISQFITPPPSPCRFPPLVSIRLFSTSVSQFLPCKLVHLYHFSRLYIYALIYNICSLSDLLHSVWQSLDPSMSQQMTQFHSFLWLGNIPLYICTTSSLFIRLSMGI